MLIRRYRIEFCILLRFEIGSKENPMKGVASTVSRLPVFSNWFVESTISSMFDQYMVYCAVILVSSEVTRVGTGLNKIVLSTELLAAHTQ